MPTEIEFEDRGPAISNRDLVALERKLGVRLPDYYRAFLLHINGGSPRDRDAFDISKRDASLLSFLYSVRRPPDDRYKTYILEKERLIFKERIPADLLPIGFDQGGSQICLGIGKENYGKVFFWDMEDERDEPSYENVALIAESFAEFLDSLYSDEDE